MDEKQADKGRWQTGKNAYGNNDGKNYGIIHRNKTFALIELKLQYTSSSSSNKQKPKMHYIACMSALVIMSG